MRKFESRIDREATEFGDNRAEMLRLVERMRELSARAAAASEQRRPRFEERGQLTPRERLARLLDPGMPFVELFNLANYLVEVDDPDTSLPGASMITGIGFVSGVRCMIVVDDSGINAGASTAMTVEKMLGAADLAISMKLPFVHLVESAGANLLSYEVELWAKGGGMFYRLAKMSAAGIPTFVALHGPSVAGGAYMPGMSDYVIGVRGRGRAALGGAALVRAATGEVADEEELSGSQMHASVTGLVEYLAEDDGEALVTLRRVLARLDWNAHCAAAPLRDSAAPDCDPDEIAGVVPVDYRQAYDVRELVARIVDSSQWEEFKGLYGTATVCLQASVLGFACGIIGNNGPIDPQGASKVTHFIQLCDQASVPLVFLHNTTGYMVGTEYEQAGMIKHGSKMIQAVSNARVNKLAFYVGASFGAGNYGMCGLAYDPDFLFTWPNAKTGVMGGEQAARTMEQVVRGAAQRRRQTIDEDAIRAQREHTVRHFDAQSDAFYTSGRVLDHGMIDPRDTRRVIGFCLETCWEARNRTLHPNSFGVARI